MARSSVKYDNASKDGHPGSKHYFIQPLAKTECFPISVISLWCKWKDLSITSPAFVTLRTSILRGLSLSALSIGQIVENLCHLILQAYRKSITSGMKAEVIIYYWTLIKSCLGTSSSTHPPQACSY